MGYDTLARLVCGEHLRYRPCCQPVRISDCFIAVVTALAADRDLTLVDDGLSAWELAELGLDETWMRDGESVTNPQPNAGLGEFLARLRVSCRSRLTLYTSGSTGLPKAVSHVLTTLSRGVRVGERHAGDIWGFAYNPTHMAGLQVFLQALFNLNPLVNLFRLPPATILGLTREYGITHISATPTFYRLLLPSDTVCPSVRAVTFGGERTDAALMDRLRPLFPNARFRNVYASTEAGTLFSAEGDLFAIPRELELQIQICEGRLHLHRTLLGEFGASGGARVPASGLSLEGTMARQQPRPAEAGEWYDTGDVVEVVSQVPLRFRIVGRDRDWINVGGNKVNPAEVEAALLEHPTVREARVFGRDNALLGKVLCAEVVPAGQPVGEPELRQFLAARLQAFKIPRLIRSVPGLRVTRSGKLKRDE